MKLYQIKPAGEERDSFTDQVTKKYKTNEQELDAIRDRVLADRDAIMGMQHKPLREILAAIAAHNAWFHSLEYDEIKPETIKVPGALPKWARDIERG